jgi:superfamily II RNA helicase
MAEARSIESVGRTLQLPPEVIRAYRSTGLKELYDWQTECLYSTGVLEGGHLVYCAPTGGGKTLVAELVLLRTVLLQKKKVIFVLPYVSLVIEKEKSLKKLLAGYNRSQPPRARVAVRGFHGDHAGSRSYKEQVLVTTVEKANGIFNSLVQRRMCAQLGAVLFDEVHILGSAFNGHLLEMLIRYGPRHCHTVILPHYHNATLPHCHTVILLHYHNATLSYCHTATLPHCHTATPHPTWVTCALYASCCMLYAAFCILHPACAPVSLSAYPVAE